jgi:hypothetical protein
MGLSSLPSEEGQSGVRVGSECIQSRGKGHPPFKPGRSLLLFHLKKAFKLVGENFQTKPTAMENKKEETEPTRVVVNTADVVKLTGKSEKGARNMLTYLRKGLGRSARQPVTYRDFAKFFSWDEDIVKNALKVSMTIPLLLGIYLMVFEDDMELGYRCLLAWVALVVFRKDILRTIAYDRKRFFAKNKTNK